MNRRLLFVLLCLGLLASVQAELKLPAIFADHMVLQRGLALPVWGWADPGEKITVGFAGQTQSAVAGADGKWQLKLAPLTASGEPREFVVSGAKERLVRSNVLVGDVWVCSGQSNMQFGVGSALNGEKEVAAANFPQMRLFFMPNETAIAPRDDCHGAWKVCAPGTAGGFTAVGYFFGRDLHRDLQVPIGLIGTSWGGTIAEAWASDPALRAKHPEFNEALDKLVGSGEDVAKGEARFKTQTAEFNEALNKFYSLEEAAAANAGRAAADCDDSRWKTMALPANWEERGLKDLDGIVWFRKTVELPAAWAGKDLIVRPGPIDEVDVTWFNGEQVGARGNSRRRQVEFWNQPREYRVPGKAVKAGANVVAIRVSDSAGQGGLWGAAADTMYVALADDGGDKTRVSLAGNWRYDIEYALPKRPNNPNTPNRPSVLFNAMINPIVPFGIAGAIWYQGESNASRAAQYRSLLPTLIGDWRTRWGQGNFPFLVVQLANFMARRDLPGESAWAELREAQALTAATDPKVGLAVAIDIGDAKDIHPKNKQEVGRRLALAAQALAYGRTLPYSGPVFQAMTVKGNEAVLSFTHADGGLVAKDGPLTGFAVAGADRKFVWAQARLEGDKVVVSAPGVAQPAIVRYAWADNPACNLYNGAGLPAVPFRTDKP